MLQPTTLQFLIDLKGNNNKAWFDANRKYYENAKADFNAFVGELLTAFTAINPALNGILVKDCVFRINRDVRFSTNKSPYKTNFGAGINEGGKKSILGGFYFHCEPAGGNFIGGGIYQPMPSELAKIRQEIDYCFDEFSAIISEKSFKQHFGDMSFEEGFSLVRPPKGYAEHNAAIQYIKLKHFIASGNLTDDILTSKLLIKHLTSHYKAMLPLINFLNRAVG